MTFGGMSPNATDSCYLWHEEIAGRNGSEVASAILSFISAQPPNVRHIRIWADNCAPQNKNWLLYSALITLVSSSKGPDSLTLRYLERGHTFMKPDSIHGAIGRKLRGEKEVLDFSELSALISKSARGLQIRELSPSDFLQLVAFKRPALARFPKLRLVKEVHFEKRSNFLFYKFNLDAQSYFKRPFGQQPIPPFPPSRSQHRGVASAKKAEICKTLVPLMSEENRAFLENLHVAPVEDLCSDIGTSPP